MNWNGLILVITGAIYLIYSFFCKNKVNIYSKRYSSRSNMIIIKASEFFRLQLYFSILNSIVIAGLGTLIIIFNLSDLLLFTAILLFHFIHFMLIIQSKKMGYVDYKTGQIYK